MYAFYLVRGHSLKELESLSPTEELFYMLAMDSYYERVQTLLPTSDDTPTEEDGMEVIKGKGYKIKVEEKEK